MVLSALSALQLQQHAGVKRGLVMLLLGSSRAYMLGLITAKPPGEPMLGLDRVEYVNLLHPKTLLFYTSICSAMLDKADADSFLCCT